MNRQAKAASMTNAALKRAKSKGLAFDLTPEWVEIRLRAGICEATGIMLTETTGGRAHPFSPSLDRIDPKRGYLADNCKITCWIYNRAKGENQEEYLITLALALNKKINPQKQRERKEKGENPAPSPGLPPPSLNDPGPARYAQSTLSFGT
jgi:hypothetical protein